MILIWLVLSARCSGSSKIPLDSAEQSTTLLPNDAAQAIDNDNSTSSCTTKEASPWLGISFKSRSPVDEVVIERAYSQETSCNYTVSVYDGEAGTVCDSFYLKSQ